MARGFKGIYLHRGEVIMRDDSGGWIVGDWDANIYKALRDAINGADKRIGGTATAIVPRRIDKPISVIGKRW